MDRYGECQAAERIHAVPSSNPIFLRREAELVELTVGRCFAAPATRFTIIFRECSPA